MDMKGTVRSQDDLCVLGRAVHDLAAFDQSLVLFMSDGEVVVYRNLMLHMKVSKVRICAEYYPSPTKMCYQTSRMKIAHSRGIIFFITIGTPDRVGFMDLTEENYKVYPIPEFYSDHLLLLSIYELPSDAEVPPKTASGYSVNPNIHGYNLPQKFRSHPFLLRGICKSGTLLTFDSRKTLTTREHPFITGKLAAQVCTSKAKILRTNTLTGNLPAVPVALATHNDTTVIAFYNQHAKESSIWLVSHVEAGRLTWFLEPNQPTHIHQMWISTFPSDQLNEAAPDQPGLLQHRPELQYQTTPTAPNPRELCLFYSSLNEPYTVTGISLSSLHHSVRLLGRLRKVGGAHIRTLSHQPSTAASSRLPTSPFQPSSPTGPPKGKQRTVKLTKDLLCVLALPPVTPTASSTEKDERLEHKHKQRNPVTDAQQHLETPDRPRAEPTRRWLLLGEQSAVYALTLKPTTGKSVGTAANPSKCQLI